MTCLNVLAGIVLSLLLSAQSVASQDGEWSARMQALAKTLSELMPAVIPDRPLTPENRIAIEKGAKELVEAAHGLKNAKPGAAPNDADPTLGFVSGLFEREAKSAYGAFRYGQIEYARRTLRSVTSYCIACHTRHDGGPALPTLRATPAQESLTPFQRGELMAATRQFDGALAQFEKLAGDADFARDQPLAWGRAVRHAFTIAVRVKQDPAGAKKIVSRIERLPAAPPLFQEMVPIWKRTIEAWQRERKPAPSSEKAWFAEAKRLYDAAQSMQKYWHDRSADILYLRFSLAAHQLLTRYPQSKHAPQALLWAGIAYELLDDWIASPLPTLYFESCVRRSPHTPIARQCYRRYEENVHFGYTGSAGTFLPDEVLASMRELRKLAAP